MLLRRLIRVFRQGIELKFRIKSGNAPGQGACRFYCSLSWLGPRFGPRGKCPNDLGGPGRRFPMGRRKPADRRETWSMTMAVEPSLRALATIPRLLIKERIAALKAKNDPVLGRLTTISKSKRRYL